MKKLLSAILPGESIPTRKLSGTAGRAALVLTVSTALVHFWMNSIGLLIAIKMNAIHLGTLMAIIFLFYPAFAGSPRERPSMPDWVLATASLGCMVCCSSLMTGFYRRTFRLRSPILRSPWSPWPFSWKRAEGP